MKFFYLLFLLTLPLFAQETKYYNENGGVVVSWFANSDSERVQHYTIYWSGDSTNFVDSRNCGEFNQVMFNDVELVDSLDTITASTVVFFAVTATNEAGEGERSKAVGLMYLFGKAPPTEVIIKRLKLMEEK